MSLPGRARARVARLTLLDASVGRREYDCVFVQPGRVLQADGAESEWLIPAGVLQQAAPAFNGLASYVDHPARFGFGSRQAPSVRDLAGVTFNARWDEELQALCGGVRLYDQEPGSSGALMGALMDQVLDDMANGRETPEIGLSAVFWQRTRVDEESGLTVTTAIERPESVDFVYSAGARGYVRAALERLPPGLWSGWDRFWNLGAVDAPNSGEEVGMSEETGREHLAPTVEGGDRVVDEMVAAFDQRLAALEAGIGRLVDLRVGVSQETEPAPEIARLEEQIGRVEQLIAEQAEASTVQGHGTAPRSRASVGPGSLEQVELALDALLAGVRPPDGIRPLTGIRELYHLLSGDYGMTGLFQEEQVYLANVTTSTMSTITANALNKRVMNEFQQYPQWWARAVTIEDFTSLQDVRWTMLGGVGELPTVAEGAAYTEMTWDDKVETDSFVKKGGYLGLTIEAIDKDDTGRLRAAPRALAQSAWMTLGKAVSTIFTTASGTGPTLTDTGVLFNATATSSTGGHANLLTTALSMSAWRAVKLAMMKQTELNSGERMGALLSPKFLWVPVDLEDTAVQILATQQDPGSANWDINVDASGNVREERLSRARERVIVSPFWTDTNNWAAQADPQLYPSIGLAFRYGRQPEIFSVADPRAGLMFTNDIMPIKVRFFFATGPIDYRGLHKSNVS